MKTIIASRTDKHVHALNQTLSFRVNLYLFPNKLQQFLNRYLIALNIFIKKVTIVDPTFNACKDVKNKTYLYIINYGKFCLFQNNYEYHYPKPLSWSKMEVILPLFLGYKNFLSFSTSKLKNTYRLVRWIKLITQKKRLFIFINGNGFLQGMVRMMVATWVRFCENNISQAQIMQMFVHPIKGACGVKMSPRGLYLYQINY